MRLFSLLNLIVLFSCCALYGADPFLPPESTFILVAGLPGDLESESTYGAQLQSWLEILQSVRPKQIVALADNPDSVAFPRSPGTNVVPLTVFPASRSNFQFLGSMLTKQVNSLVVMAWGHGGKQGNTPVFHVRGPRITAADFSALADQIAASESSWVLSFRGSGFFAAQLAKDKRQILSSESDTMFNSDPVESSLLLKIIRDRPAIPVDTLSKEIGRATVDWYKERNLARTEEPTFWRANEKPVLLARAFEENSLASIDSRSTNSPETTSNAPRLLHSDSAGVLSAVDLPAAWKELKKVNPQDYPDADAVILRRRINYTLGTSPAVAAEHDDFIQILTVEGKHFGDLDISYNPPLEDIDFSECEVLSPEGKLARLNPDAIREANDESVGDYQAGRRKFFSLPGVVPGAVLHVHYRNEWKKFPLPHISLEIPVSGELAAVESSLQVTVPKDEPFHFALENSSASLEGRTSPINPDPVIKQTSYGAAYMWQFTNLNAESREILAPPRQGASLLVSTFPDWSDFAEWYARISKLTDAVTPEIGEKAADLTREAKTDRDKIVAIYNYVTSLRYVAIPLGVNSFRPHAAANVFKNQFGDCKDKANLFNAMLHSVGITAHLVLVPRFRQAYDGLPGLAFNHAISHVALGDQTFWVDTTDDVCRFGMLPPGDGGRKVLVIAEQTNSLSQLPSAEPEHHELTIRGQIDCSSRTDALPGSFSADALGYPDYELREAAREAKEHAASFPLLAARFRLTGGSFALDKQSSTSVAALNENFSWHAEGDCVGVVSLIRADARTAANSAFLRAPFWLPKEWDFALHRRKTGLFLNQGYPLILDEQLEISLPPGTQLSALPALTENREGPLKWKVEWTKESEAKLRATFRAALAAGELSASEASAFQQQLRAMISALSTIIPL
jgi:hypothetical protein